MIISREVDINVNRYGLRVVIPVVQYDSGRQIIFNIVDAELPSGCTSNIFIKKPSGKSVYNACAVSGNKVTVTLTNQSLSEYGFNDAQIQIIKGEEVVTSFSFILEVKQSDADNAVISKSESTFFQGIVNKAQAAATTAERVLDSIPDDYSKLSSDVNTNTAAIATLNSSMVAIPSTDNKRLLYVFDTDCNLLTQEFVLGGGNNFPAGERFWYIHSIAYLTNSDGTIKIGKQIAYAYSSGNISYERLCNNGTWGNWEKLPTRAEVDALNSRTKAYIYDQTSGSFLDWVRTTFTSNGEYYVIYATNNYDGWVNSSIGSCLVQRRNNDYFLTAYLNETNVVDKQAIYVNRYVANVWIGWSKLPTRSEINANTNAIATNTTAISTLKPKVDTNTNAIATLNDNLGGYKLVGYTASVVLNKAGEFIIPYPSGENFGTVYGILSATFLQGGYCLPNPPLTPSSTSPAYDIQAAVAFRLLSTGIAIYTGGAWGADSRDIYFVLICKA